jgi:hypothetical protein
MRIISFSHTTPQFRARTKDVTRRKGWKSLKPGERLRAVVKAMGLRRGEKVEELGTIEVVSVRREPIDAIHEADVAREGFPEMSPREFVAMFCRTFRMKPRQRITRIEYRFVD